MKSKRNIQELRDDIIGKLFTSSAQTLLEVDDLLSRCPTESFEFPQGPSPVAVTPEQLEKIIDNYIHQPQLVDMEQVITRSATWVECGKPLKTLTANEIMSN